MDETVRIYIGTDPSQRVAAQVLEHSLRKSCSLPLEVTPLDAFPFPMPREPRNQPRTPFSFSRFLIPRLAGYQGRAIYLDADMIVFRDIAELWRIPFNGARVLCTYQERAPRNFKCGRQMSVMLLDCARLPWKIEDIIQGLDDGAYTYEQLMGDLCIVPPSEIADTIPPEWNCLEHYEPGSTALLHYTQLPTQPWRNRANPLRELWLGFYREALAAGRIKPAEVCEAVQRGYMAREFSEGMEGPRPGGNGSLSDAESEIRRLRHEVAALQGEIEGLRRSWTWRVGRLFVGPVARLKHLIR